MVTPNVRTGLQALVQNGFKPLQGARVGAIVNPTAVDANFTHLADLLHRAPGVTLACLFGPEHGVRGDAQDMIGVGDEIDPRTGVVVHSLYGETFESLKPTPEQLADLDVVVYDVQDVGSRYYTYAATLKYVMLAAHDQGKAVMVLDRPNPIGGVAIEGPTVAPGHESFISAHPLPIRHGMTVGELARLFQADLGLNRLDLRVIPCEGWDRRDHWPATGLPFVPPSPNMPTYETALVYPGGCLIEGTQLSEGRGTTRPFELWGAPWLDPEALAEAIRRHGLPGVAFRPCVFRPTFHKHAESVCRGVMPYATDPARFRPLETYARLLGEAALQHPDRFAWRTDPYEFVSQPIAIDLLFGSPRERLVIDRIARGELHPIHGWSDTLNAWRDDEAAFRVHRRPFLLYPEPETIPLLTVRRSDGSAVAFTFEDLLAFGDADQVNDVGALVPGRVGGAVKLAAVLMRAGVDPTHETRLILRASRDGFAKTVPTPALAQQGWIIHRRPDGHAPLPIELGGPLRLVVPAVASCDRSGSATDELDECVTVKGLDLIEVTN